MGGLLLAMKAAALVIFLICTVVASSGCARVAVHTEVLPPVLTQDELLRPYEKVATIEVRRDRYGSPEDLIPEDYSWAYQALRQEAARIGADAVIIPEVTIERHTYIVFPTSYVKAKGIAIKFR